jgi:acyl phosphate:glycerol-3-phosphate acyltransferase
VHPAWGVAIAFALGSIPFAWIAGRLRGVDLRMQGSGNLGATNALRVLGVRTGAAVYVLDTLKGFVAAFALPRVLGAGIGGEWAIAYAVASVAGHVRPVFLGFRRGGKGVATAGGAFLGLAPAATLIAIAVFAVVFAAGGYVSLGSLAAAVTLPVALLVVSRDAPPLLWSVALLLAVFMFWSHRANIGRLMRGQEHRFDLFRRRRSPNAEPRG